MISRGKVIVEDGKFVGRAGDGEFLKRSRAELTMSANRAEVLTVDDDMAVNRLPTSQ